ncbi:major facilitator superfamily domain-containing protein [Coemansia spiralis]|nr:major facilitator superfamily domain-containing protein [Coemansia spiralis]
MKELRSAPSAVVVVACIAVAIDNIAFTLSFACLPHIFEDMELASESTLGLVAMMFGIGSFITSITSGIVSDHVHSRKLPMLAGALCYALSGITLFFSKKLHHVLLYRLINGLASGLNYPIATATVGDVYPHKLLGLQMALVNTFANVGYTVGPVLGGCLYDSVGIRGVSIVLSNMNSLSTESLSRLIELESKEQRSSDKLSTYFEMEGEGLECEENINGSVNKSGKRKQNMPLWKLVFQWQVLSASITTLTMGMLSGSLENVLPIYTKDRFNASASKTGLLFVLNGSVAIALSAPIGWFVDRQIRLYGENMRIYVELAGIALIAGAVTLLGFGSSFHMVAGTELWFAASLLIVNVPVMSSFGDFVNSLGLNSMAQSYGLYNSFWSLSSTIAPPIATALYTQIGYKATVSGFLAGLCAASAMVILSQPTWLVIRRLIFR